ncbi:MAG: FAD-dependent oxidoreductase [Micrococcales bacterium]|nr:FAD-dependent oxidoreductase [Micrococcales bacterium]
MTTRPRRIAIVGAGPSGLFAAQALASQDRLPVEVDLIERLPTPFGLLRYGVAPDHENIKAVATALAKVLEDPAIRFWGMCEFGRDTTREELLSAYDAVVYAVGASEDVQMGIPGESVEGSRSAREFVAWYGGHPDATGQSLAGVHGAAAIGVGNVAVDVARILLKTSAQLSVTDMPQTVLDELGRARVDDVWIVGRRGPQHASYTTKELRELVQLPGLAVSVSDGAFDGVDEGGLDRRTKANVALLGELADGPAGELPVAASGPGAMGAQAAGEGAAPPQRRLHFLFWRRPVELERDEDGRLARLVLERTRLDGDGRVVGTGERESIDVQLVLRSIGYRSSPLPGVPFDTTRAVVPNAEGRVLDESGQASPREYCVGWVKRGPIGVIGTNKSDAAETVGHLVEDLLAAGETPAPAVDLPTAMRARGYEPSTLADWRSIDAAELALGREHGRERTKIATWEQLVGLLHTNAP